MEHKLITGGGEHWLPFARSKIRVIKSSSLTYGSQKYVMPDGAEVEVRVVAEQEYIRISASQCKFYMDSGVVDVRAIHPNLPDTLLPGTLYETDGIASYNAPFVLPDGGGKYRLNPSSSNAAQISGNLTSQAGAFKGAVPVNAEPAASFSPRKERDDSTVPATISFVPSDDNLTSKKVTAIFCPASVFTGRCRLYVQALYGQHLYVAGSNDPSVFPDLELGSPPGIRVPSFKRTGESFDEVPIGTSDGVMLDKTTGKHWLVSPGPSCLFFPLVGTPCAEGLRKYLVEPVGDGLDIGAEGREHLEAYILSTCLPDRKNQQTVARNLDLPEGGSSMGYGWHWNWDGDRADIVVNEVIAQEVEGSDDYQKMRSTHFRVELSKSAIPSRWLVNAIVVEPAKEWMTNRFIWAIAEPDHNSMTMYKTTPHDSQYFDCDAPFYVFYDRDVMQLCRFSLKVKEPAPSDRYQSTSPNYAADNGDIIHRTIGERDGWLEDTNYGGQYYIAEIKIGEHTTGPLVWERYNIKSRYEVNKIVTYTAGPAYSDDYQIRYDVYFQVGYPPYGTAGPLTGAYNDGFWQASQYHLIETTSRDDEQCYAAVVVPFFESEAVYLQAYQSKIHYKSGVDTHWDQSFIGADFGRTVRFYPYHPSTGITGPDYVDLTVFYERPAGAGWGNTVISSQPSPVESYTTVLTDKAVLITRGLEIKLNNVDSFSQIRNGSLDEVSGAFEIRSGTSVQNPVVLGDKIPRTGIDEPIVLPVIVGWV